MLRGRHSFGFTAGLLELNYTSFARCRILHSTPFVFSVVCFDKNVPCFTSVDAGKMAAAINKMPIRIVPRRFSKIRIFDRGVNHDRKLIRTSSLIDTKNKEATFHFHRYRHRDTSSISSYGSKNHSDYRTGIHNIHSP